MLKPINQSFPICLGLGAPRLLAQVNVQTIGRHILLPILALRGATGVPWRCQSTVETNETQLTIRIRQLWKTGHVAATPALNGIDNIVLLSQPNNRFQPRRPINKVRGMLRLHRHLGFGFLLDPLPLGPMSIQLGHRNLRILWNKVMIGRRLGPQRVTWIFGSNIPVLRKDGVVGY